MTIRKEQTKSLIWTEDREFKQRGVNFLNNVGFANEKFSAGSKDEFKSLIETDKTIRQVLIDASSDFIRTKLDDSLDLITKICKISSLRVLVFCEVDDVEGLVEKFKDIDRIFLARLPFDKKSFNEAYHGTLKGSKSPSANLAKRESPQGKSLEKKKSISAFEASAHVKETIVLINELDKNKEDLETLGKIGQLFNGLIGAFAFYGERGGWFQLKQLAEYIDDIARTYLDSDPKPVSAAHFKLLLASAKASFMLLQDLRNSAEADKAKVDQAEQVIKDLKNSSGIRKRKTISQQDVDTLIGDAAS